MSLHSQIRDAIVANPSMDDLQLADLVVGGLSKVALTDLVALEVARVRRQLTRDEEHRIKMDRVLASTQEAVRRRVRPTIPAEFAAVMDRTYVVAHGKERLFREMSIEDHEQRINMLENTIRGLERTVQFHRDTIAFLKAANAKSLDDLDDQQKAA